MKWEDNAILEVKKVPFFIRNRVKKIIEKQAEEKGLSAVSLNEVKSARTHFMKKLDKDNAGVKKEEDLKLYELIICRGDEVRCPFVIKSAKDLGSGIVSIMKRVEFNKKKLAKTEGIILPHNKFKISISTCPNGCSQPHIKNIGILLQSVPGRGKGECTNCRLCVETCRENAIEIKNCDGFEPIIDFSGCVHCGMCAKACKNGALIIEKTGYKLLIDGKLGRHPRLAREIINFCDKEELLEAVEGIIKDHLKNL